MKWWLVGAGLIALVIILRNPAAFVGSTLGLGQVGVEGITALQGGKGNARTQSGSFKAGGTSIKLGG